MRKYGASEDSHFPLIKKSKILLCFPFLEKADGRKKEKESPSHRQQGGDLPRRPSGHENESDDRTLRAIRGGGAGLDFRTDEGGIGRRQGQREAHRTAERELGAIKTGRKGGRNQDSVAEGSLENLHREDLRDLPDGSS